MAEDEKIVALENLTETLEATRKYIDKHARTPLFQSLGIDEDSLIPCVVVNTLPTSANAEELVKQKLNDLGLTDFTGAALLGSSGHIKYISTIRSGTLSLNDNSFGTYDVFFRDIETGEIYAHDKALVVSRLRYGDEAYPYLDYRDRYETLLKFLDDWECMTETITNSKGKLGWDEQEDGTLAFDIYTTDGEPLSVNYGSAQAYYDKWKSNGGDSRSLFVEMWNEACGEYGRYNVETGYFELNGLTNIRYPEAKTIMLHAQAYPCLGSLAGTSCRTNIIKNLKAAGNALDPFITTFAFASNSLEVVRVSADNSTLSLKSTGSWGMFCGATMLRKVLGILDVSNLSVDTLFHTNPLGFLMIEEIRIKGLNKSCDKAFRYAIGISLNSLQYLIANATNTTPITITVSPEVYAKLTNPEVTKYIYQNLLLDSDVAKEGGYSIGNYLLGDVKPDAGDDITVTIWGELAEGKSHFGAYNSGANGNGLVARPAKIAEGVYSQTSKWIDWNTNSALHFYALPEMEGAANSRIDRVKLELGTNSDPQWTPYADATEELDEQTKEAIAWVKLYHEAKAKNITFVSA